jgi:hypothetical protein
MMMDQPIPLEDVFVRNETARHETLQADLEVCYTLVERATTEHGTRNRSGFLQAREKAETAFAAINLVVPTLRDPSHRKKAQTGLNSLRVALDQLSA